MRVEAGRGDIAPPPELRDGTPAQRQASAASGDEADASQTRGVVAMAGGRQVDLYAPRPDYDAPRDKARTLSGAFEAAYDTNATINQARANLRAADEGIAVAKSGNRPTLLAEVDAGVQTVRDVNVPQGGGASANLSDTRTPTRLSLNVTQPLFRGFRTRNAIRQAEANVRAERDRLKAIEQQVFQEVAIAYVDVRRARGGVALREQEIAFLADQVNAARARLTFGEGTRTDIDQAEARLAETRAVLAAERSNLAEAEARLRELTGLDTAELRRDIDVTRLLPRTLNAAINVAMNENPTIHLAINEADEANFNVKGIAGEALPSLSVNGRLQGDIETTDSDRTEAAELRLVLQVPIYQGGRVSAQVREAKETLGSRRIGVDVARDAVRADTVSAWATYVASLETIEAAEQSVIAAQRAVAGLLEELRVGQRTTVDVLNAQRDLIDAQITRIEAIRQRDGAGFVVLRSMGRLDIGVLGINVEAYDPREHYSAVKDKWIGLRTPDGR
ncbi:MAG: TolC family outer membrane protein [Pseudomonadota bacterium]